MRYAMLGALEEQILDRGFLVGGSMITSPFVLTNLTNNITLLYHFIYSKRYQFGALKPMKLTFNIRTTSELNS